MTFKQNFLKKHNNILYKVIFWQILPSFFLSKKIIIHASNDIFV